MFNPLITATAGWSEAVEWRAQRFLEFVVGTQRDGAPVTAAAMLERRGYDPVASARFLMMIPPQKAVRELARTLAGFRIDGEPCPDPLALARAALAHAGRAVTEDDLHPERRWLAALVCRLLGRPRPTR